MIENTHVKVQEEAVAHSKVQEEAVAHSKVQEEAVASNVQEKTFTHVKVQEETFAHAKVQEDDLDKNNIRIVRKETRDEKRDAKNYKNNETKLENLKMSNDIKKRIYAEKVKLEKIRKKIKYDRNNLMYKQIETDILDNIAIYNVNILKLDHDFMMRNAIRTQICSKVEKNKECKYEECTFAHSEEQIRKPKCIAHIYGICYYGNRCIHDHSNSELPKIPVKLEEVTLENLELIGLNIEIRSLIEEYLPSTISIPEERC